MIKAYEISVVQSQREAPTESIDEVGIMILK
jgi:hypothetical protein